MNYVQKSWIKVNLASARKEKAFKNPTIRENQLVIADEIRQKSIMKNLIESLKEESENSRTAESPKISLQIRGKQLEALVDSGRVFKYFSKIVHFER